MTGIAAQMQRAHWDATHCQTCRMTLDERIEYPYGGYVCADCWSDFVEWESNRIGAAEYYAPCNCGDHLCEQCHRTGSGVYRR